jgi:hypothetical protein
MKVSSTELKAALGSRYPGAAIHVLDRDYEVRPRSEIVKSLRRFHKIMKCLGLVKWITGKLDCDKWSLLFKAYHTYLAALNKKRKLATPIGFMCFYLNGEVFSGHAIAISLVTVGGQLDIIEIDTIPGRGVVELNNVETKSAWLITI